MNPGHLSPKPSDLRTYDQGWQARMQGEPRRHEALPDWREGWDDADDYRMKLDQEREKQA